MTTLDQALASLSAAQFELNRINSWGQQQRLDYPDQCASRILACDIGGQLAVEYYGECWEDSWELVQRCLSSAAVAPHLAVLRLSGPDEGANGLRSWDFAALLAAARSFPHLKHFYLRPTGVEDHNHSVVEPGQLPALLELCPELVELIVPQSPEPAFFSSHFARLAEFHLAGRTAARLRFDPIRRLPSLV